jgi:hypothetical protein
MTLRSVSPSCLISYLFIYSYDIHAMGTQSDMLMWLMSEAKGVERSLEGWARRLLMVNFSSIHTITLVRAPFSCHISSFAN